MHFQKLMKLHLGFPLFINLASYWFIHLAGKTTGKVFCKFYLCLFLPFQLGCLDRFFKPNLSVPSFHLYHFQVIRGKNFQNLYIE